MTALFHYGLIEQVPHKIWVMVPNERRTTHTLYRCVKLECESVKQFSLDSVLKFRMGQAL